MTERPGHLPPQHQGRTIAKNTRVGVLLLERSLHFLGETPIERIFIIFFQNIPEFMILIDLFIFRILCAEQ